VVVLWALLCETTYLERGDMLRNVGLWSLRSEKINSGHRERGGLIGR